MENNLEEIANKIRINTVKEVYYAKSGHPGGSLSIADILAVLYFKEMKIDPKNPKDENRDRFVLSKGHCSPALYATLALKGFFSMDELKNFRNINSILQGHPDMKKIPGIDMSTGSLGQGLSAANGMAIAGKLDNKDYRVYAILGDGEIEEGQVWEAAMASARYKLDNLCIFVDNNNLQIDGTIDKIINPYPIDKKLESFGFYVININGNDTKEIEEALNKAKQIKGMPTAIIAKTIKGKGVSFMEDNVGWHGKAPNEEEYKLALTELGGEADE
ncbi:MAG: transketolase [Clostridia bacterium]|nr:transketolase [Clostridia bacterium]